MPNTRKSRPRGKHRVRMTYNERDIMRAGSSLELRIFRSGATIGHLTIGAGSIIWRGRLKRTGKRIRWSKFAEMMDDLAYGE